MLTKRLPTLPSEERAAYATCIPCPAPCRAVCPVAEADGRETVSPRGLMVQAGLLADGRLTAESVGDRPWHCTGCGACTDACGFDVDVPRWLGVARSRVASAGFGPAAVAEAAACFGVAGNALGLSLLPALEEVLAGAETRVSRVAVDVYFPGCATLHARPGAASAAMRASRLLEVADLRATEASALCCGAPLLEAGDVEGFVAHAARLSRVFAALGRLVVHDSACARTFRAEYARYGILLAPQIVDLATLWAAAPNLEPRRPGLRYAVLAACGEPPVGLLDQLLPGRWRALGPDCCGAGGLMPIGAPAVARDLAEARVAEWTATGTDALLALSPRCAAHLAATHPDLPVLELAELICP